MPAEIEKDPLGIACVFSDGTSARFSLGGLPCPGLARDLLAGLAELVHTARSTRPGRSGTTRSPSGT